MALAPAGLDEKGEVAKGEQEVAAHHVVERKEHVERWQHCSVAQKYLLL